MKYRIPILLLLFSSCFARLFAQSVTERPLVLQLQAMQKVQVKENIQYKKIADTSVRMDIYYPPGFNFKTSLPVVIFNNGIGSFELPKWRVYTDWARLVAANGMIAVNYQCRGGRALPDGEDLISYLTQNAKDLNIDTSRIGLWTCSANARTGMRLAYKSYPKRIRALVVYYGSPDSLGQLRQDLPAFIVRAGLDAQFLNMGIENFVQEALMQDARVELINYVNGIHAFDIYTNTEEAKSIIKRTVNFLKENLHNTVPLQNGWTLTNRNFMWLIRNGKADLAMAEFRKARDMYRADSTFHPFYNAVIREDVLNANAYWLLRNDRRNQSLKVFKLMIETYPESPNAHDSYSEALELSGDKPEAIRYAKMALQMLDSAVNMNEQLKKRISESASGRIQRLQ